MFALPAGEREESDLALDWWRMNLNARSGVKRVIKSENGGDADVLRDFEFSPPVLCSILHLIHR